MREILRQIFVSKPNTLNATQSAFWNALQKLLKIERMQPRVIGDTDFSNSPPCEAVRNLLSKCDGAIVLGLRQIEIVQGVSKKGTRHEKLLTSQFLPTPWNHLEAGMSFAMGLPLLIIHEAKVTGGIFDLGNADRFIHQAKLSKKWLASQQFSTPFHEWKLEVARTLSRRTRSGIKKAANAM
jgi:hypothetical protein